MRKSIHPGLLSFILFCLVMVLVLTSTGPARAESTPRLILEKDAFTVNIGRYGWINSHIQGLPAGVYVRETSWESSDPGIVDVNHDGKYTAVSHGTADLIRRVRTTDGAIYEATCTVTVIVPVERLTCDTTGLNLWAGETAEPPEVTVVPADADVRDYVWTSSAPGIVEVDGTRLHAHSPGRCTLTATSTERLKGRTLKSVSITVTVLQPVEDLSLAHDGETLELNLHQHLQLQVQTLPARATAQAPVYASSDPGIASVTQDGIVTAESVGTCTISASVSAPGGRVISRALHIHVICALESVKFTQATFVGLRGQTLSLSVEYTPAEATDTGFRFTSDNPFVAGVDPYPGQVTCNQVGAADIFCTSSGGKKARARVLVEPTVPLTIRSGQLERQTLVLQVKSRFRETRVCAIRFTLQFLDTTGAPAGSPVLLQAQPDILPARVQTVRVQLPDIPDSAESLSIQILQADYYEGGSCSFGDTPESRLIVALHKKNS